MHAATNCDALCPSSSLDSLEQQITELTAHIHAATYRLLCLLAEFDRREGWAQWGILSCAHWLNWKCGLGLGAAREKLRVARSLEGLPAIAEAFRRGEVSYSKVRAMTRVATPENQDYLLQIARHGTANHVERLVRKYRRVQSNAENQRANALHDGRYLHFRHDEDGALIIEARLAPETGELVLKALGAAGEALYARRRVAETTNETESNVSAETPRARALYDPPGPTGGDACAEDSYANRRADALVLMAESLLTSGAASRPAGERQQIVVHMDAESLADADCPGRSALEEGPFLATETARRMACDASVVRIVEDEDGMPLNVGRKTRSIPPALKSRDGGCVFPGCTARHFVEGHHVRHWAHGGETSLTNLVQLCTFHHRLVHEGGFDVQTREANHFIFTRPDGRVVEPVPDTGSAQSIDGCSIEEINRDCGLDIDADAGVTLWDGTRMDYRMAMDALLARDDALVLGPGARYPDHFPRRS
jgi:hypothetical protein